MNEACLSFVVILFAFCFGSYSGRDCSVAPFKLWTLVEGCYYSFNFLFSWVYYRYLVATNRESMKFLIFNCLLNVVHTGWLLYGNVIFWPNYDVCGQQLLQQGDKTNWVMGFLIVMGYITLCKCCTVTSIFICFAPQIVRAYRRANNPAANWQPTSANILKNIVK
jgi:hypothetical protein